MPGSVFHVLTSPVADVTGTVTVFNASGGTKTEAASNIVRPSDWNSSHAVTFDAVGSEISGAFSNTPGGVTFGLETNGYITAGAPAGGGGITAINVSAGTASQNLSALTFNNGGGVSFGLAASVVTATVATNYAASDHSHGNPSLALTGINGTTASNSAGLTLSLSAVRPAFSADASSTFQTLTFQDSNGVSFSNNAGAIRITHGLQFTSATSAITSNAAASNHSHGASGQNGSFAFQTLSFSNANGVSFGTSAGSAITASHNGLTTAAASDHSHGNPTLNLTNLSGTTASNSAGFTLSLSAAVGGAGDGGNILAAGTRTAGSNSSVLFDNANGVTFGLNAVNGSVMTASHNGLTTARASNDGLGTATAQTNVTWTANSNGLSLNAAGYAGTGTTFAGANISASVTLNSVGWNGSFSVAAPGAAAENNNINLLGANTAGNTTASGSTIGWSGVNVTLSGTNASQVVISAPASSSLVASNGISISTNGSTITVYEGWHSQYVPHPFGNNSSFSSLGQNTLYLQFFYPPSPLSITHAEIYARGSFVSSTNSQAYSQTVRYGLYSQGTGASTSLMTQVGTSSIGMSVSYNSNTAYGYTLGQGGTSITSSSGGTALASHISGPFHYYLPFSTTMDEDIKYAFAIHVSSTTAVNTGPMRFAPLVLTIQNSLSYAKLKPDAVTVPNATVYGDYDMVAGTVTTNAMPASIAFNAMSIQVSRQRLYLQLEG